MFQLLQCLPWSMMLGKLDETRCNMQLFDCRLVHWAAAAENTQHYQSNKRAISLHHAT
jgi:hypothetical protein